MPKEQDVSQATKPEQHKELILAGKAKSVLNEGKSIELIPQAMDQLQRLHHEQMEFLKKQRITPIPIILEQIYTEKLPYKGIPFVTPTTSSLHDESQAEVRVFSILYAINTISQATIAMIDETKPCGHEDELKTLKDKVQQVTTTKGELED